MLSPRGISDLPWVTLLVNGTFRIQTQDCQNPKLCLNQFSEANIPSLQLWPLSNPSNNSVLEFQRWAGWKSYEPSAQRVKFSTVSEKSHRECDHRMYYTQVWTGHDTQRLVLRQSTWRSVKCSVVSGSVFMPSAFNHANFVLPTFMPTFLSSQWNPFALDTHESTCSHGVHTCSLWNALQLDLKDKVPSCLGGSAPISHSQDLP